MIVLVVYDIIYVKNIFLKENYMKKKLLLVVSMVSLLVCLFAISVSAETVLKSQTTNAYGELSFFDESVSVGRTNNKNGFTPYISATSTDYARVVMGNGTTFYTFPTAYILSESTIYGSSGKNIYVPDFTSLNSAMEAATGTNPKWTAESVYRIELPYTVNRVNGGTQNFAGYTNVIEIRLQPNSGVQDAKNMIFWKCKNLETIHNLDTFVFTNGSLGGSFQECAKLTNLTIGVSSAVTKTDDNMFNGCSSLVSVNFAEAFPNLQTIGKNAFYGCSSLTTLDLSTMSSLTTIKDSAFSGCSKLTTIKDSANSQEGAVRLPYGITTIEQNAFAGCSAMKYLSLPSTLTSLGQIAFDNCTGLLFIDFNDNQNIFNVDRYGQFRNCSSLLAVSLPDDYKYIPNQMFKGCASLKAVYLPGNLTTIDTNGWSDDPFNGCTNLYFVQNSFEVVDANGNFYTKEAFVQPTKPEVYYMPNSLSALCTNKTSGKCFTSSVNLNRIIVFGTNVTKTTLGDGIFYECGSNGTMGSEMIAVFLGDMEQLKVHPRDNRNKGVKYVFANENDKSFSDITISSNYNGNYNLSSDKTEGFYFCHSNSYYLFNGVKFSGTYTNDTLTKQEGTLHLYKIAKETPATCTVDGVKGFVCFCGAVSAESETIKALGHKKGATVISTAFPTVNGAYNYFANMISVCPCATCGENAEFEESNTALFATDKGYSFSETDASSISYTLHVNKDAIEAYMKDNIGFMYGIVVSASPSATPIKVENGAVSGVGNTLVIEMQNTEYTYSYVRAKLTFGEDFLGKEFNCQAYVVDNSALTYVGHEGVSLEAEIVSHAILVEKYEPKEEI